jgi:hypothetical protein
MKLEHLSGVAAIAFAALTGAASAGVVTSGPETISGAGTCNCTITVITAGSNYATTPSYTEPDTLPFTPLALGNGASGSNATINPGGGISSITFSGGTPDQSGLYSQNLVDHYLSPFGGSTDTNDPSLPDYLVAGANGGSVTINYATTQTSFALLWGTLDESNENQLLTVSFNVGGNRTVTGSDINAALVAAQGTGLASGQYDVGVVITDLPSFTSVTASDQSSSPAFEFDIAAVPAPLIGGGLPAVLAVCGGLFGFKLWERSKKRRALGIATPLAAA